MSAPVLRARSLAVQAGEAELLAGVEIDLHPGQVLAVVGASGSGKSTLGLALLGESAPGATLRGSVLVGDAELVGSGRGPAGRVGYLPQHPGAVLDPLRRVGAVLDEMAAVRHGADRAARSAAVRAALQTAHLPADELSRRFPHQLSGGQQQRMALALALVTRPDVVVLDEPTTGLDPDSTRALVQSLAELACSGVALVLLTHDHDVARVLAHEALALRGGRVEAQGPAAEVLAGLGAAPVAEPLAGSRRPRLRAEALTVVTADGRAILDGVDLAAPAGAAVAVVGPSGAGKTTLARALAGLVVPRSGTVEIDGAVLPADALDRGREERRAVQYVHQDPRSTFAPGRAVLDQVARPAVLLRGVDAGAARAEAVEVLGTLGLDQETARRRGRALSGGQLQRAAVARALLARPAVIVADEATSALDADHRAGLVEVFDGLRDAHGTTLVLVSHDLELVGQVAGTTVALDAGRVIDRGTTADVLERTAPPVALGRP